MSSESFPYTFIEQLPQSAEAPPDGILSRNLYKDENIKVVLFAFGPGQELSEHTASMPAVVHVLEGEGSIVLGEDEKPLQAGTWVHMAAHLPHSVRADTPLVMLLTLLKQGRS